MPTEDRKNELELLMRAFDGGGGNQARSSIFDAQQPVDPAYIEQCRAQSERFGQLRTYEFPREGFTREFFGLGDYKTKKNAAVNPLELVQPKTLHSVSSMFYYGVGSHNSGPKTWAKSAAERGWDDDSQERLFVEAVKQFEELFVAVLESTNISDPDEALIHIQGALAKPFASTGYRSFAQTFPKENPANWLTHAVLSVALSPAAEVKPLARVRALSLLNRIEPQALAEGFFHGVVESGTRFTSVHRTGLPEAMKLRVPHTWATAEERRQVTNEEWHRNPRLAVLLNSVRANDFRGATNEIFNNPREAVEVTLLMLHSGPEFGLELLRKIPQLDRGTLDVMFGPQATFYVDQTISNSMTEQIAQGAGTEWDPTASFNGIAAQALNNATPDELRRLLAAAMVQIQRTEEVVGDLAMAQGRSKQAGSHAKRSDPKGYCRALGLDPQVLDDFEPDKLEVVVRGAYRTMSKIAHPDQGGTDAQMKEIGEALEKLLDVNFRANYGTRSATPNFGL